jgi:hypothetical protein
MEKFKKKKNSENLNLDFHFAGQAGCRLGHDLLLHRYPVTKHCRTPAFEILQKLPNKVPNSAKSSLMESAFSM